MKCTSTSGQGLGTYTLLLTSVPYYTVSDESHRRHTDTVKCTVALSQNAGTQSHTQLVTVPNTTADQHPAWLCEYGSLSVHIYSRYRQNGSH